MFDLIVEIPRIIYIAVLIIIHIIVAIHILLTKHENPSSAMLWILLVIILPVGGLVLYLIFGINRLKKMGNRVRLSARLFNTDVEKKEFIRFEQEMKNFTCPAPDFKDTRDFRSTLARIIPNRHHATIGNKLELLKDGTMAYPEMLKAIREAKYSIHMQSFIIMNDPVGQEIFNALADKADEGVDVKVIYDRFGSAKSIFSHFFHRYARRTENLKIRAFTPVNIFTPWRIQLRNHRKLMIVDGRVAFIGGINISEGNVRLESVPKNKYIHDLHCRITGPSVTDFQMLFLRDWVFASRKKLKEIIKPHDFAMPEACGNNIVRVIDSGPGQNFEASQNVFFTAAATADKFIWIMTPYFVPDRSFVKALCMAAARGVEVRIIVPQNNNHFFVNWASQSLYHDLLASGIRIFEKKGIFTHAKAMVIDGKWTFMGSSNCDVRSFKLNYELDFCVEDGDFVNQLLEQFNSELKECDEVHIDRELKKPLPVKLVENLCSLLTPIL